MENNQKQLSEQDEGKACKELRDYALNKLRIYTKTI